MLEKCLLYGDECSLQDHKECSKLYQQYCKVVFCDDDSCLWNVALQQKKIILHHKAQIPFAADGYRGVCSRSELGVVPRIRHSDGVKSKVAECAFRSDKFVSGHLDFTKIQQGGNIPDPVDPGTAFHV